MTVRDLGEQGLLQRLQRFCPIGIVGDDGAVLDSQTLDSAAIAPGQSLIVTTDLLVDGVHFSLGLAQPEVYTTTPADAGWRATAANLSDLAAMGATPIALTVGLGLPGDLPLSWLEDLYGGMAACLEQYGGAIVGGDIVRSPVLTVAITALGQTQQGRIIQRSTAQPGDAIVITGSHGNSRAGLELLLHPDRGQSVSEANRAELIRAHQRPIPRLDVLPWLWTDGADRVTGMDSSDGLADAIVQICRLSGVGAIVDRLDQAISPAFSEWVTPEQALDWALYGGEDFELVLCLPPPIAQTLVRHLGQSAAIIGSITVNPQVLWVDPTCNVLQELTLDKGFQHF
ncbi:thiamine-phosphate kinase [Leptolyngbya sp. 'hensonii']|nr:thiamine-phosphate kinase [Leptolyngbya sp. 'hensonii']